MGRRKTYILITKDEKQSLNLKGSILAPTILNKTFILNKYKTYLILRISLVA